MGPLALTSTWVPALIAKASPTPLNLEKVQSTRQISSNPTGLTLLLPCLSPTAQPPWAGIGLGPDSSGSKETAELGLPLST